MKKFIGLAIFIGFISLANAQTGLSKTTRPGTKWMKFYGGTTGGSSARFIQPTTDHGYVICGSTSAHDGDVVGWHGGDDYWVVKIDSVGTLQWKKCMGGGLYEEAYCIRQCLDGGYIVCGSSDSPNNDVVGNHGGGDAWIVKLSSTGVIQWKKCFGGTSSDNANSIIQRPDSSYIFVGQTSSIDGDVSGNHGNSDFWVVKLNTSGTIIWQRCYGGTGSDGANSITPTADGGYVVAGETASTDGDVVGNNGSSDFWVIKFNSMDSAEWKKCYGTTNSENAIYISQTAEGGYIIGGNQSSCSDFYIVKTSPAGLQQWSQVYWGSCVEYISSIEQTNDGGYIMGGSTCDETAMDFHYHQSDAWIIKTDTAGIIEWNTNMGGTGTDDATYIHQLPDGGYIMTGQTGSNDGDIPPNGWGKYWITRFYPYAPITYQADTCGLCHGAATVSAPFGSVPPYSYLWDNATAATSTTISNLCRGRYNVSVTDAHGKLFVGSVFIENLTLDSVVVSQVNASCNGCMDGSISLHSYSQGYNFANYEWIGYPLNQSNYMNNIGAGTYVCITHYISCFIVDTIVITEPSLTTNIESINSEVSNIKVFYESSSKALQLRLIDLNTELILYDINGRELYKQTLTSTNTSIDLSTYNNGIYFYELRNKLKGIEKGKFVKD